MFFRLEVKAEPLGKVSLVFDDEDPGSRSTPGQFQQRT